jgi:hypothetical protein
MLIRDGYAEELNSYSRDPIEMQFYTELDHYQGKTILTPAGYYFITEGGYSHKKSVEKAQNDKLETIRAYQIDQLDTLNRWTKWIMCSGHYLIGQ